ncbi:hypothetical protein [Paraburkholderia fungorum]|uniref:hypothetical protein n=1 Tax=Paraburkholderia fungorum TaxID=134537 RepID=UPI0038B8FEF4
MANTINAKSDVPVLAKLNAARKRVTCVARTLLAPLQWLTVSENGNAYDGLIRRLLTFTVTT